MKGYAALSGNSAVVKFKHPYPGQSQYVRACIGYGPPVGAGELGTPSTQDPIVTADCATPSLINAGDNGTNGISLTWYYVYGVTASRQMYVERSVNGGAWVAIAATTAQAYTDTSVVHNNIYEYRLRLYAGPFAGTVYSSIRTVEYRLEPPAPLKLPTLELIGVTNVSATLLWGATLT